MSTIERRWNDLPTAMKAAVVTGGVIDAGLRIWALADLKGRDADEVRGPKPAWALALSIVNSAGLLPAVYLLLGRQRA